MRYDLQDEKGKTRRERNSEFGHPSPELVIPLEYEYLWSWYNEISSGVARIRDGVCYPVAHSEILAWQTLTQNLVLASEYAILRAIDSAFCDEMNKELKDYRERTESKARGK